MTEQSGAARSAPGSDTTAGLLDALIGFDGPPEQFLAGLLTLQCRVGRAEAAAILRPTSENVDVLALFPTPAPGSAAPPWLSAAAESAQAAAGSGRTVVKALHGSDDLYGSPPKHHLIATPLRTPGLATRNRWSCWSGCESCRPTPPRALHRAGCGAAARYTSLSGRAMGRSWVVR